MPTITAIAPAILVNNLVANNQFEGFLAKLAGGGSVIAWIDFTASCVVFAVYNAEGVLLTDPPLIANTIGGEVRAPTIAVNPNGEFMITWTETLGGSTSTVSQEFRFGSIEGGPIEVLFAGDEIVRPHGGNVPLSVSSAAFDDSGGRIVVRDADPGLQDIRGQRYDAQDQTVGGQFTVNTTTAGQQTAPVLTWNSVTGFYYAAWVSENAGTGTAFQQQLDRNGNLVGTEQNLGPAIASEGVDLVALSVNTFAQVWVRPGTGGGPAQLFVTIVDGLNPPTDVVVADVPNGIAGRPSIETIPGGGFVVSWIQDNTSGADPMLGRAYDANFIPFGSAFTIADSARFQMSGGVIRLNDGVMRFTWDGAGPGDPQGVFYRDFRVVDFGNIPTDLDDELWAPVQTAIEDSIFGQAGNDIIRTYAGNDTLAGGDGDDVLLGGPGNDAMNGGMGNDFGLFDNPLDSFIGGPGTDTAGVQGNFTGTLNIDASTEAVLVASGIDTRWGDYGGNYYDYDITLAATWTPTVTGIATVVSSNLRVGEDLRIDGGAIPLATSLRVFAGDGLNTIIGGAGNDGSFNDSPGSFNPLNTFNGGPGSDTLAFRGNFVGGNAIVLNNNSIVMVDAISLLSGQTNEFGGILVPAGFDYDLTLANGNVAPGGILIISGNNLKANETVDFDGSAELDGSLRIYVGAGNDSVVASSGADLIWGNLGGDNLNGGPGADTYVYRTITESGPIDPDTIIWTVGDKIDLTRIDANSATPGSNDAFTFIGNAPFSNVPGQLKAYGTLGFWTVEGDVNGDGIADFIIDVDLNGSGVDALTADSFML